MGVSLFLYFYKAIKNNKKKKFQLSHLHGNNTVTDYTISNCYRLIESIIQFQTFWSENSEVMCKADFYNLVLITYPMDFILFLNLVFTFYLHNIAIIICIIGLYLICS